MCLPASAVTGALDRTISSHHHMIRWHLPHLIPILRSLLSSGDRQQTDGTILQTEFVKYQSPLCRAFTNVMVGNDHAVSSKRHDRQLHTDQIFGSITSSAFPSTAACLKLGAPAVSVHLCRKKIMARIHHCVVTNSIMHDVRAHLALITAMAYPQNQHHPHRREQQAYPRLTRPDCFCSSHPMNNEIVV